MAAATQQTELLGSLEGAYRETLESLRNGDAVARLFARDASLWKDDPAHAAVIRNRLGWLDEPGRLRGRIAELQAFSADVRAAGFTRVLLLGMGGSSLAPEVLKRCMTPGPGAPILDVLDATDPDAVRSAEAGARLDRTFFLVSSKSGTTLETLSQYRFFRSRVEGAGLADAGSRFAAITDPGSPLEALARAEGFRKIFRNPPDIGGRYSALSYFGMVPAALLNLDLGALAARAESAREASLSPDPARNGALRLGALLGAAAREGRDKLTILTAPFLRPVGFWIEQLIAESTGKEAKGIVPVEGEPLGAAHHYGADRVFVSIELEGEPVPDLERLAGDLSRSGAAWVRIVLPGRDSIAGEFFRWEVATSFAGAVLRIDPFDEPNVQESKDNTKRILDQFTTAGVMPAGQPVARDLGIEVYAEADFWSRIVEGSPAHPSLEMVLHRFLTRARAGEYVALLAFMERTAASEASFALIRRAIRNALRVPVLQGYGPRYLHSIGQLYKGGPRTGLFLVLTASGETDLPIPGSPYTFGQVETAQALGDIASLASRGKPALRLHMTKGAQAGLEALGAAVERAIAASAQV
ncbi:MAG TPA: transaldolase [Candidatus Omnitrophota bacterium]|jgi:glucose-6-phosphate isomerase|nr:transaldolase [Candidatus Omnitrophota bacterium]